MLVQHTPRYWTMNLLKGALGESGWESLEMARRRFHWNRTGIAFIHIPKAAGSSISNALYGRRLGHVRYSHIERRARRIIVNMPIFSVMREPGGRLISAYRYVKSGGTGGGAVYDLPVYHEPVFASFESFLFDWLPKVRLEKQDYVFQPQVSFLEKYQGGIDRSVKLFTLEYGMADLADYLRPFASAEIANQNANRQSSDVVGMRQCLDSYEGRQILETCYSADLALYRSVCDSQF